MPFFAAAADGLFAEPGLEVELAESAAGSQRVKQLAEGAGDFLLSATLHHLQALAESGALLWIRSHSRKRTSSAPPMAEAGWKRTIRSTA